MKYLERATWERFAGWLLISFLSGRRHSRLRRGEVLNPEARLG